MKLLIEKAINRYLSLDPESKHRIAALQGKAVTLELLGINLIVQLLFSEEGIQIKWEDFLKPDVTIRGTPLNLFHMSVAEDQRKQFFEESVVLDGDMELAQPVLAIFDELEIDWEEYLSQWIGDVPAHQAGRLMRGLNRFRQKISQTSAYNLNEYVHEEINLFPPAEALQQFFREVDELRMDVDRLEARVNRMFS